MMNRGNQKYNKSSHFKLLLNIFKSNCNVVEKYLSSFVRILSSIYKAKIFHFQHIYLWILPLYTWMSRMLLSVSIKHFFSGNCDFELNTCGWTVHEDSVFLERNLIVCGILGDLYNCATNTLFQSTDPWQRKQIRSINLIGT